MSKDPDEKSSSKGQQTKKSQEDVVVSAVRHVGPTLESDPRYLAIETGSQTPESLIEQGIGIDDSNVRDIVSRGTETELRRTPESGLKPGEPLKTRLPGDTSSDPHTDVGPDNAANLKTKPDVKRDAA